MTEKERIIKDNWEELGLSNDFLFGKIMRDPEICKGVLQRILPQLSIERIEYPELQKEIKEDIDARSVRLDVYVRDDRDTVYNIEMQTVNTKELPKRSRYYQSMMDLQLLDHGQSYKKLNQCYIIFICLTDLFEKGRHIYTFKNICQEDGELALGDGTEKLFLNANGQKDDVSPELKAFLDYVAGKPSEDQFVQKLKKAVNEAKKNREWRREYMTLLMRDQENIEKGLEQGRKEGREEGESRLSALIQKLIDEKRAADVLKVSKDKEYREQLYREYGIE